MFLLSGMTLMTSCSKPEKKIAGVWKVLYAQNDSMPNLNLEGETWTITYNKEINLFVGNILGKKIDECYCLYDGKTLTLSGGTLERVYRDDYDNLATSSYTFHFDKVEFLKKKLKLSGKLIYKNFVIMEDIYENESWNVTYELERSK